MEDSQVDQNRSRSRWSCLGAGGKVGNRVVARWGDFRSLKVCAMRRLASEILSWKAKELVSFVLYVWKGKTMLRWVSITTCILLTAALLYGADQSKVPQGYVLVDN